MIVFYQPSWTILHHWSDTSNMMGENWTEQTMSWSLLSAGHGYNFLCLSASSCWKVMRQNGGGVRLADGLIIIDTEPFIRKHMESTGDMEKPSAEKLPTANMICWCERGQCSQSDWRIIWITLAVFFDRKYYFTNLQNLRIPAGKGILRCMSVILFKVRLSDGKNWRATSIVKNHNLSKLSCLDGSKILQLLPFNCNGKSPHRWVGSSHPTFHQINCMKQHVVISWLKITEKVWWDHHPLVMQVV